MQTILRYFSKLSFLSAAITILTVKTVIIVFAYIVFRNSVLASFSFEKTSQILIENSDNNALLLSRSEFLLSTFESFRNGILDLGRNIIFLWITSLVLCSWIFFKGGKIRN
jgi:hypothetical protein